MSNTRQTIDRLDRQKVKLSEDTLTFGNRIQEYSGCQRMVTRQSSNFSCKGIWEFYRRLGSELMREQRTGFPWRKTGKRSIQKRRQEERKKRREKERERDAPTSFERSCSSYSIFRDRLLFFPLFFFSLLSFFFFLLPVFYFFCLFVFSLPLVFSFLILFPARLRFLPLVSLALCYWLLLLISCVVFVSHSPGSSGISRDQSRAWGNAREGSLDPGK